MLGRFLTHLDSILRCLYALQSARSSQEIAVPVRISEARLHAQSYTMYIYINSINSRLRSVYDVTMRSALLWPSKARLRRCRCKRHCAATARTTRGRKVTSSMDTRNSDGGGPRHIDGRGAFSLCGHGLICLIQGYCFRKIIVIFIIIMLNVVTYIIYTKSWHGFRPRRFELKSL